MTTLAIHLTEDGVYASSEGEHWFGGTDSQPLVSAEDEFSASGIGIVPTTDAVRALIETAVTGVGSAPPVRSIAMTHPTHWGSARIRVYRAAALHFSSDVTMVPLASIAARTAMQHTGIHSAVPSYVVLESSEAGVVVTCVDSSQGEYRVVGCDTDHGHSALAEVVRHVSAGRIVDGAFVCGIGTVPDLDAFGAELSAKFGRRVPVQIVSAEDVAKALDDHAHRAFGPVLAPEPSRKQWLSAPQQDSGPERRSRPIFVAAAAMAVVVSVCAIALFMNVGQSTESVRAATETAMPAASAPSEAAAPVPSSVKSVPSSAESRPTVEVPDEVPAQGAVTEIGRIRVQVPEDWQRSRASDDESESPDRFELVPVAGSGSRIVFVQNELRSGIGYDEVATTLGEQISRSDRGRFSELDREVAFGGRPGISYSEFPADRSQVNWHVLIDQGVQVSVGCQFERAQWATIVQPCEQVVRSLAVSD
ncbi:MAG: type VII secretion-associated protein [Rhodococcus sp.]|nr:type VII secretion-associated protein [Rhodococcus sp. (in: high G+C Gram-positive bacteria)]